MREWKNKQTQTDRKWSTKFLVFFCPYRMQCEFLLNIFVRELSNQKGIVFLPHLSHQWSENMWHKIKSPFTVYSMHSLIFLGWNAQNSRFPKSNTNPNYLTVHCGLCYRIAFRHKNTTFFLTWIEFASSSFLFLKKAQKNNKCSDMI